MDLRGGVHRAAQLRHPQLDAIVAELGEHGLDLACVAEGALGLAELDPGPPAVWVGQRLEEGERFFALRPRQRARGVFVVGDRDDLGAPGSEPTSGDELPAQALLGVLLVGC